MIIFKNYSCECPNCKREFSSYPLRRVHQARYCYTYTCNFCNEKIETYNDYKKHECVYRCKDCDRFYTVYGSYNVHCDVKQHRKIKKFTKIKNVK